MKTYLYFILALFVALASCQKVVDADKLLDTEEKVYIVGFLSPSDTVFRVNVSKALPAIGTPLPTQDFEAFREAFLIKDASVQISDADGNRANLIYSDSLDTYLADASLLSVESEQTYFLEVIVSNQTYNASCFIPRQVNEIDHEVVFRTTEFGESVADVKFSFQDFVEEKNFYMLGGNFRATYTYQDQEPIEAFGPLFFNTDQFLTDNILDGETLGGNGVVFIGDETEVTDASVTVQVAHMEEIIFQNMRTDDLNFDAEGNPFVEYAIAPNNILDEGAVGVFAGYQITEKVIDIDL